MYSYIYNSPLMRYSIRVSERDKRMEESGLDYLREFYLGKIEEQRELVKPGTVQGQSISGTQNVNREAPRLQLLKRGEAAAIEAAAVAGHNGGGSSSSSGNPGATASGTSGVVSSS